MGWDSHPDWFGTARPPVPVYVVDVSLAFEKLAFNR